MEILGSSDEDDAQYEFQAYRIVASDWLLRISALWGLLSFPIIVALWASTSVFHGTLGSWSQFSPVEDTLRFLGSNGTSTGSSTDFPLSRDFVSIAIAAIGSITVALVIKQWQLMRFTITKCVENGVLKPYHGPKGEDRLQELMYRANRSMHMRIVLVASLLVAIGMVILLEISPSRNGLFVNLSQIDDPGLAREWATIAYENWWASRDNLVSYYAYHASLAFFAWVIALQNVAGIATVFVARHLEKASRISADWLNRDGWYGWAPMVALFRTVRWSLALHGFGIGFLILLLGTANIAWLSALLVIWAVFTFAYLGYPWIVLRRGIRRAVQRRVAFLTGDPSTRADLDGEWRTIQLVTNVREAKISAVGLRPSKLAFWVGAIAAPVLVALIQVNLS